jgi:periplasmic protein TonB
MKTQASPPTVPMDDLIFANRNKSYGAYFLRRMYNRQLAKALFVAIALLAALLAYPVVSVYRAEKVPVVIPPDPGPTVYDGNYDDTKDLPDVQPQRTDDAVEPAVNPFKAPEVVTGPIDDNPDISNPLDPENFQGAVSEPVAMAPETTSAGSEGPLSVSPEPEPPMTIAEIMPAYPGGEEARAAFLGKQLRYPQRAAEIGIQGTVFVSFVIDTEGNVTQTKVLRGIGYGCDEEALRILNLMPKWSPGIQNGRRVRVLFSMGINFQLL